MLKKVDINDPQIEALLKRNRDALADMRERPREYSCHLSMLEIMERIQLYVWGISSQRGTFRQTWQSTIGQRRAVNEFLSDWSRFWYNRKKFITTVVQEEKETLYRYIFKEYEASLSGQNIHFDLSPLCYSGLEFEHVFPKSPGFDFRIYGFADETEYSHFISRSGNLTFLPKQCNVSLGSHLPDLKATEYVNCGGHPIGSGKDVASKLTIVRKLGKDIQPISNPKGYRSALEIRCVELAIFSLRRFLG